MLIKRSPLRIRSEFYSREFEVERSHGCHMKTVLDYVMHTNGYEKKYEDPPDPNVDDVLERYAACGFIWEHVMTREMAEVTKIREHENLTEPGELMWCYQCNETMQGHFIGRQHCESRRHVGIYATPDAFRLEPWRTAEFKFTWKSSGRTGEDHMNGIWMWPRQTLGYSYLGGTVEAELYAMFAVGGYQRDKRPEPEAYCFEMWFDRKEAERNWDMIVTNAIDGGYLEV